MFFFFKQKTAYEMRISDWSSDVCSSDLFSLKFGAWQVAGLGDAAGFEFLRLAYVDENSLFLIGQLYGFGNLHRGVATPLGKRRPKQHPARDQGNDQYI